MIKNINKKITLLMLFLLTGIAGFSQATVTGVITDAESGETLIGVNVFVEGTVTGTITGLDGDYTIKVKETPATLVYSFIGYESVRKEITGDAKIDIALGTDAIMADEVVVSASRVEESILESPVTIEKLDLIAIQQSASADYYDEIIRLKGVHHTQASLAFTSINARGFGGNGNTRFVQLQDGMDNASALLNFPSGNIVGISELDIKNVEMIPGASSALYGPNAFNGILLMESKDPFRYQGLSVQVKTGMTEGSVNSDPLFGGSIRYAKAFNDKFAFKLNFSGFTAKDWDANNYTGQRSPTVLGDTLKAGDPAFDGINVYGDEILIPLFGGIKRTGWNENILLDNRNAESFKFDGAFHYRINDKLETNVSYKYGTGASVYQGSERYAFRGFNQQFMKAELNSDNWNIRAYRSISDAGDSYNMTALGSFASEALFPTQVVYPGTTTTLGGWAVAYNLAYEGAIAVIPGLDVPSFDHDAARAFADGGGFAGWTEDQLTSMTLILPLIVPGLTPELAAFMVENTTGVPRFDENGNLTPEALEAIKTVRGGLFQRGGAGFIDDSNMNHVEGNYDFSSLLNNALGLQVGANYRLYSLYTEGTVFNEDPDGDGVFERINIGEYGAYVQASKKLLEDRLKLSASVRFDKNQNFEGQFTPRISTVYTIGENRTHNIRASYQTGFRNPTTQGQYIYFPTTNILLGGTRDNAERYGIFEGGAWSEDSYYAYLAALGAIDPNGTAEDIAAATAEAEALRTTITLDYVQPEKLQAFEIGYKGITNKKLFIDANVYYSIYKGFIQQDNIIAKEASEHQGTILPAGTVFRPYFNAPVNVNAYGFTTSLEYVIKDNWKLSGNYSYNDFSINEDDLPSGFEDFNPGFNTPKHKINFGLFNRKILDNLSFGVNFKWQERMDWFSSFGEGEVPSFYTLDAQIGYRIPKAKTTIKLGVNNLTKNQYVTNYGSAIIGRMPHLTITYDQFSN